MSEFSKRDSIERSADNFGDGSGDESLSTKRVAVALSYTDETANAPRVIAAGKGHLAEAILESAFANDVKVRTDPDLAAILASVDVGAEIPEEAFVAVAEILSYLYRVSPEKAPDMLRPDRTDGFDASRLNTSRSENGEAP